MAATVRFDQDGTAGVGVVVHVPLVEGAVPVVVVAPVVGGAQAGEVFDVGGTIAQPGDDVVGLALAHGGCAPGPRAHALDGEHGDALTHRCEPPGTAEVQRHPGQTVDGEQEIARAVHAQPDQIEGVELHPDVRLEQRVGVGLREVVQGD